MDGIRNWRELRSGVLVPARRSGGRWRAAARTAVGIALGVGVIANCVSAVSRAYVDVDKLGNPMGPAVNHCPARGPTCPDDKQVVVPVCPNGRLDEPRPDRF